MRRVRVLHVITGLSTGGAERALYNVLSGGLARQFECSVVSLRDAGVFGERIAALGVPVRVIGVRNNLPTPSSMKRLYDVARETAPDVVQGWMYHGNLGASVAAQLVRHRPAVAWNVRQSLYGLAREKPLTRQVIRANRWMSHHTDVVVYNSRVSREQHEIYGFAPARGTVIANGFHLKHLGLDVATGERVRSSLGIPGRAPVMGHVARFHPMKDHSNFLRAAVRVAEQHSSVRFLAVGREVDGGNSALTGIVPRHLADRFYFLGERQDVPDLMRAMDLLCSSSAWGEGFPNVLGEAMASELPCVTTDVGDSADVVGRTGVVVPPMDDVALADGMLTILSKSADERRKQGRMARNRIENCYALPRIVEEYGALYERLSCGSYAETKRQGY